MSTTSDIMQLSPVIPVVTIDDPADAIPVATALRDGGVPVIELTLRTPRAFDALQAIAANVDGIEVGVGTVLTPEQARTAVDLGATFLVSPGCTAALAETVRELGVPFLPGVATVSEAMTALDRGFTELKFFPAGPAGGAPYLASLQAPLPGVSFCPTGGVSPANARDYLALGNVLCVGGSWLTPADAIAAKDWNRIAGLAADAARLR